MAGIVCCAEASSAQPCLRSGTAYDPGGQRRAIFRGRHPCLSFAKQNLTASQHKHPGRKFACGDFSGKETETTDGVPGSDRNDGCGHAAGAGLLPPAPDLRSANRVRVRWICAGKDCLQIRRAGRSGRARRRVSRCRTGFCGAVWESVAPKRRRTVLAVHGLRDRISRRAGAGTQRLLRMLTPTAERDNILQHDQPFTRSTYLKV